MKQGILRIYDFLVSRRWLVWLLLAVLLGLFLWSSARMAYQEDIAAFLPHDAEAERYAEVWERLGGQERIAVFFEGSEPDAAGETDRIIEAMTCFGEIWADCDSLGWAADLQVSVDAGRIRDVFSFIAASVPYYLTEADYARMDSLLARPGYVEERLDAVRNALYAPGAGSFASVWMRSDPLDLFSPVLARLGELNPAAGNRIEDGFLFTPDGRAGVVFFNSPFGGSESDRNGALARLLQDVSGRVEQACPGVRVFATGGPLVAAENADRIKKDSILAVCIAVLLIALVLWFSFRRFSDVLWIAVTILFGTVFAVGMLALVKPSISVIVLGIGSMIIGIAVNYPLHFADHLKYTRDRRKSLADQINPLLVGNITTVGAFLSLLLLNADALHDFGAMGALMLAGTILFVLFFLPVLMPESRQERRTLRLDWDRHIRLSRPMRQLAFFVFLGLTVLFLFLSRKVSFDPDMQHINYMTDDQRRGFALLGEMAASEPEAETVYVVAEGADGQAALECNEALLPLLSRDGAEVHTISAFLPSERLQAERLARWQVFRAAHPDLGPVLQTLAGERGFAPAAFAPFLQLLSRDWTVQPVSWFEPIAHGLGAAMYLPGDDGIRIVNYVKMPREACEDYKASLRPRLPEGSFCFHSSDVGNRLVSALSVDFDKIGLLCSLIVFLFLWLSFRRIELSLLSFLPLAVGWVWILGLMQLLGLRFNIVNIILATFIFGQGDDYTIFITEGLMYEHACGKKILRSYKNCVMLSALIMFIGIGALVVARHPAMRSLAYVTIIGMFTVVMMAWYLPPLVFLWLTRHRDGRLRRTPLTLRNLAATAWISMAFGLAMLFISLWASVCFRIGRDTEKKRLRYHRLIQRMARFAIRSIPGAPYTLSNPHGEDFSRPAIYVCNHQSHFDVLALLALQPKLVFMTNDWVWKFYGTVIRKAEFYPASFGLARSSEHMRSLMERGYSVAIFPEGTRSMDCSIQRFHRGAFLAARELNLDILPLYIHGFGYALPKHEFLLRQAGLYLEVGERVPASAIPEDIRAFVRNYRHAFAEVYERIRRERETAAYLAPFVREQYLYKGEDAMRECASVLKRKTYEEIDGIGDSVRTVSITGSGCGVYALLLAMTCRDKEVYACETDEEKYLTALRCQAVPANLHYCNDPSGLPAADLLIER